MTVHENDEGVEITVRLDRPAASANQELAARIDQELARFGVTSRSFVLNGSTVNVLVPKKEFGGVCGLGSRN